MVPDRPLNFVRFILDDVGTAPPLLLRIARLFGPSINVIDADVRASTLVRSRRVAGYESSR